MFRSGLKTAVAAVTLALSTSAASAVAEAYTSRSTIRTPGVAETDIALFDNPATNVCTDMPDTPATILANDGSHTFILTFKSAVPFDTPGPNVDCSCGTVAPAVAVRGVNTVDLIEVWAPTPDIIALVATVTNNGVVEVPLGSAGAFAVPTDNLGVAASIASSVDTNGASLPIDAAICQANPSADACPAPPAGSATLNDAARATPTFSIFVASNGTAVPIDPANSRIQVQFGDSSGLLNGSTSVAVETE